MNTLENIIDDILRHDGAHPDHGIGCACHDKHAGAIRHLIDQRMRGHDKSLSNLRVVFDYVRRNP